MPTTSDDNDQLHSTTTGRFETKGRGTPDPDVLDDPDFTADLTERGRNLFAAWRDYKVDSGIISADPFRDREDAIEVQNADGSVWMITSRDTAAIMICEDLEDDYRGWCVDSKILAENTGVDARVFDKLKTEEPELAGELIGSIIDATGSAQTIGDQIAANSDALGIWFSTYDDETVRLNDELVAFQRE